MRVKQFRNLQVWQKSMELAHHVYQLTKQFPKEEMFGLTSQMRRAAISVPSNIAEGQGRLTDKAFSLFLSHSRGSLFELENTSRVGRKPGLHEKGTAREATRCIERDWSNVEWITEFNEGGQRLM